MSEERDQRVTEHEGRNAATEETVDQMPEERVDELIAIARDETYEPPVGAEEFVEALRLVAHDRDEVFAKLQRTAADYQNFQRRASVNEREARELARAGVAQSMVTVVDYFDMALKQNPETATVEQVIGGVQMIRAELLRVLGTHGVTAVEPGRGTAFDPNRHEALEHSVVEGVEPGTIAECRSPGYMLGDRMIRPAKVVVASASADGEGEG